MTDGADSKPSKRAPILIGLTEMANILVFAKEHGAARAAREFNLAERTITRKRARIRQGREPELAELIQLREAEKAHKYADKLDAAYDKALTTLEAKLAEASVEELTEAVKVLADARLNRDVLLNEPVGYRQGAGAATAAGQAARGAGASTAVAGGAGATGNGAEPVH